jgi:hypothetical protein
MHPLGVGGGGRAASVPASLEGRALASPLGAEGVDVAEPGGPAGRGGAVVSAGEHATAENAMSRPSFVCMETAYLVILGDAG